MGYDLQAGELMKNNVILVVAVTLISIVIIAASVIISTKSSGNDFTETSENPSESDISDNEDSMLSPDNLSTVSTSGDNDSNTSSDVPLVTESIDTSTVSTSSSETSDTQTTSGYLNENTAEGITALARSLIGVDFMDGGDTPSGFDNSGFVYYVLRENGYITCPRGVTAQSKMGTALDYESIKPGDLVFFYNDDMTSVGFGGIYVGDGLMIACLMPGTKVAEVNISSSYYQNHFSHGVGLT